MFKRKSSNNVYHSNGLSIKDFNPGMDDAKATFTTKAYKGDINSNIAIQLYDQKKRSGANSNSTQMLQPDTAMYLSV